MRFGLVVFIRCLNFPFFMSILQKSADLEKRNKKLVDLLEKQNLSTAKRKASIQLAMIVELSKKSGMTFSRQVVVSNKKEGVRMQSDNDDNGNDDDDDNGEDDKESTSELDEVADSKRGREGTKSVAEDESDDDTEDNIEEMKLEVHDFRWKLSSQQNGYFLVSFDDSNVNEKVDLKTMLHDFPERVIRFMWEKYSRSEKAMSYVERCAKGDLSLAGN
jgi:hypothetical protein